MVVFGTDGGRDAGGMGRGVTGRDRFNSEEVDELAAALRAAALSLLRRIISRPSNSDRVERSCPWTVASSSRSAEVDEFRRLMTEVTSDGCFPGIISIGSLPYEIDIQFLLSSEA